MAQFLDSKSTTYPMRVVSRMTGLSPERLRAWESRHRAIDPVRTEGGTRRYTDADVERLRLLRLVTEAGHRIGDVAPLDVDALRGHLPRSESGSQERFLDLIAAVDAMEVDVLRDLLEKRRRVMLPHEFARDEVLPLAEEIGRRWVAGATSIAAEHRATNVLRSLLIEAVETGAVDDLGPRILFAAPEGERHDLGILSSAISSRAFGARPIFVGADVPADDLVAAATALPADVLALGFVISSSEEVESTVRAVRRSLPERIALWIGGRAIIGCAPVVGVDRIEHEGRLEAFVLAARQSAEGEVGRAAGAAG